MKDPYNYMGEREEGLLSSRRIIFIGTTLFFTTVALYIISNVIQDPFSTRSIFLTAVFLFGYGFLAVRLIRRPGGSSSNDPRAVDMEYLDRLRKY